MAHGSMIVSLQGSEATADTFTGGDDRCPWVRLEQVSPPKLAASPKVSDIHRMWLTAATGGSAQQLRPLGCPVEIRGGAVYMYLSVWAWPSDPDMNFTLSPAWGRILTRWPTRERREKSFFVNHSRIILLPYYMHHASFHWESPVYTRHGERIIPAPTVTLHNTWVEISEECFGVLRVTGTALGEAATIEMVLDKPVNDAPLTEAQKAGWYDAPGGQMIYNPPAATAPTSVKISNVKNSVTAAWVVCVDQEDRCLHLADADDECEQQTLTDTVSLETPECAIDLLGMCPDMYQTIILICRDAYTLNVYYNACTGEVIDVSPDNPTSYCSKSVYNNGQTVGRIPNPWWPI